jgi:hypothetical protein
MIDEQINELRTDERVITLLHTQAKVHIINAKITFAIFPRAGGKTTGVFGPRIDRLRTVMPRCQILLVSDTYDRLIDRIVPNIIGFFEDEFGMIEGVDFVKFKKPPDHFIKPLVPLSKYEHVISFNDGTALCLVSLRVSGSGNAYNAQAMLCDEAKYCDEEKLNTEVMPALRGAMKQFGHLPEYRSQWYCTDKYGPGFNWIKKKKKLMNQQVIDSVEFLQLKVYNLLNQSIEAASSKAFLLIKEAHQIESKLNRLRKKLVHYCEMPAKENVHTVGEEYFRDMKRLLKNQEYDVAILNQDPGKVEKCFYSTYSTANKYSGIEDYRSDLPFIIAMDWQFRICPMPIAQLSMLPDSAYVTLNFIDALHTLYPQGIEACVRLMCEKYKSHQNKTIQFLYDHTAIGRNPIGKVFKQIAVDEFEKHDWNVEEYYMGKAPDHDIKFEVFKEVYNNTSDLGVRINEDTCYYLDKSMEQSGTKMSGGETKKDKSTELDDSFPAEESTHFGDAGDQIVYGVCVLKLVTYNEVGGYDFIMK